MINRRLLISTLAASVVPSILKATDQSLAPLCSGSPPLGINLAGAEFKAIGGRWSWPSMDNANYYLSLGVSIFRLPFLWERLQPEVLKSLDERAMSGLDQYVQLLTAAGATVVLDAHNYGRRDGSPIGETDPRVTTEHFADFWAKLAERYGRSELVWFGLMNEPHDQDPNQNLKAQNRACASIRSSGGIGKVLFSGTAWTGAHSWITSGNSRVMEGAHDSAGNYAYDMHQYLDRGFGGSNVMAVEGAGATVLLPAHAWAKRRNVQIFIGEFSTGDSPESLIELTAMLDFIVANPDVFIGATYWAGGGGWGPNRQTTDPYPRGTTEMKSQLKLLLSYNRC